MLVGEVPTLVRSEIYTMRFIILSPFHFLEMTSLNNIYFYYIPIEKYSQFFDEIKLVFHFSSVEKMRFFFGISLLLCKKYCFFMNTEEYVHWFIQVFAVHHEISCGRRWEMGGPWLVRLSDAPTLGIPVETPSCMYHVP